MRTNGSVLNLAGNINPSGGSCTLTPALSHPMGEGLEFGHFATDRPVGGRLAAPRRPTPTALRCKAQGWSVRGPTLGGVRNTGINANGVASGNGGRHFRHTVPINPPRSGRKPPLCDAPFHRSLAGPHAAPGNAQNPDATHRRRFENPGPNKKAVARLGGGGHGEKRSTSVP